MIYIENNYRDVTTSILCSTIKNRLLCRAYQLQAECHKGTPRLIYNRQAPTQHFITNLANEEKKKYLSEYMDALPFQEILTQETKLLNSHVPLYTACSKNVYLIQTFTKQLISLAKIDISLKRPLNDITWFRNPLAQAPKNITLDISSYLSLYGENILDNKASTAWNLISCNPHLFGNTLSDAMESTVDYWWDDSNVSVPNLKDIVNQSLNALNLHIDDPIKHEGWIQELEKSIDFIKAEHGVLFQIFIPHEEVNHIAYIAKANGTQDKAHPNAFKSLMDIQYKKTDEIINYETMQVRLLAGRLINPDHEADYRINTYSNFSARQDEKFHFAINCVIQKILKNCTIKTPCGA